MYCWRWSRTDDPLADMQPNTIVSINVKFMLIQNVNKGKKKKEILRGVVMSSWRIALSHV